MLKAAYSKEINFIQGTIEQNKFQVREKKTDTDLLLDFRFTNKYG